MSARPQLVGRYALYGALASGGMATVHIGRLLGPAGFSRTVAIKRLHSQFAKDPEFIAMFLDEARLAARIRHPNVVPTLDVVAEADELFLVMEYVHGESLARACRAVAARGERIPARIASAIVVGALHGLHAAHEARDEQGRPLEVVHRDVSPQNVIVGADGVARVLDFGVAKALGRSQQTREGQLKGKLSYMAPEQFRREPLTRGVDVYAASVVLWEVLTGERLNAGDSEAAVVERVLFGAYRPVRDRAPGLPAGIDAVLSKGLARRPEDRFASARELAIALEDCLGAASALEVAAWIGAVAGAALAQRAQVVEAVEAAPHGAAPGRAWAPVSQPEESTIGVPFTVTATRTSETADPAPALGGDDNAISRSRVWALGALGVVLVTAGLTALELRGHARAAAPEPAAESSLAAPLPPASAAPMVSSSPPGATPSASDATVAVPRRARPPARPSRSDPSALPRGLPVSRD